MPELLLDGRRTTYLDEGAGEPAVCFIHAFPLAAEMWRAQVDYLAPGHRCLAPDLYGFGGSEVLPERGDYSIPGYADQVAAVIEAAGAGPVVVVGLSMGGYTALDLARRRPDLLAGLVLADTRATADTGQAAQRRLDQQAFLSGGGEVEALVGAFLESTTSERAPFVKAAREAARRIMVGTATVGWVGALEAMRLRSDATGILDGIDRPVLVIAGEDDQNSPPAEMEGLAGGIPGARFEVIPGAGHLSAMDHPEAFNSLLGEYLASITP